MGRHDPDLRPPRVGLAGRDAAPDRLRLTRLPPPGVPPLLRAVFDQFLVAGPLCGALSALYGYHLQQTGADAPDRLSGQIVAATQSFHGHYLRTYYITPGQHAVHVALAIPAVAWLLMVVVLVTVLGVRANRAARARR